MKTFKSTIIAILLSVFTYASYAGNTETPSNDIKTSIVKAEKQSMIVHVNKEANALVKVEIRDAAGNLIYSKTLKDQKFSGKFDFSNVADGTYTIQISDKAGIVASKEISIITSREIAMR